MTVTTANQLRNISPNHFKNQGRNDGCIIFFQENLYLAYIHYLSNDIDNFIVVLTYDSESKKWQELYRQSLVKIDHESLKTEENNFQQKFLEFKIESFIFSSVNDSQSSLYIQVYSPFNSQLISSNNGIDFEVIATASPGTDGFIPLGKFLSYQNRLYALPISSSFDNVDQEKNKSLIYYCDSPQALNWQLLPTKHFTDYSNNSIAQIAIFNNIFYTATTNPEQGFQIWQNTTNLLLENNWEQIITKGAYRYSLNQQVSSMAVFHDSLYIASGITKSKNDYFDNLYQCGFELIRVYADGDWDLILGTPKFTPKGLKVPLAIMGAGFDNPDNQEVQFLVVHNDFLYLGSQNADGLQMWRTADGEIWNLVPLDDLSKYYHVEIITASSTPFGLALLMKVNRKNHLQFWLADV